MERNAPSNDVNSPKVTPYLIFCILTSTLSTFGFGFHSGVINQPREAMSSCIKKEADCIPMNELEWGTFVSLFVVGGILGAILGGSLATKFGRRNLIYWNNIGYISGTILIISSTELWQLCIGRILNGISAGIATVVVPLYISELAPLGQRGSLGSINQLSIVCGVLASVIIGIPLSFRSLWRYLFMSSLIPCILQCILMSLCVETPAWLALNQRHDQARVSLQKIRNSTDVEEELELIFSRLGVDFSDASPDELTAHPETAGLINSPIVVLTTIKSLFQKRQLWKPLIAAFGLQIAQQCSGINAAIYYSTTIFRASYSSDTAIKLTLLVSVVNLIMTLISSSLIERLGRRTLLLSAEFVMAMASLGVALLANYEFSREFIVVSLLLFVAGFGMGMGSIPWLILPELVPWYALGVSSSICTSLNWTTNFVLALIMPLLIKSIGYSIFYIFSGSMFLFLIFTYIILPETKGKSPEELQYME